MNPINPLHWIGAGFAENWHWIVPLVLLLAFAARAAMAELRRSVRVSARCVHGVRVAAGIRCMDCPESLFDRRPGQ